MLHEDASIVVDLLTRSFQLVIRPMRRDELATFAAFSDQAERNAEFAASLDTWLAGDQTRLDWLIVAEEEGAFVGRVAYTTDRGLSHPLYVVFFDAPWEPEAVGLQDQLFHRSLALTGADRIPQIEYYLDTPSARVPTPEPLITALSRFGFTLTLERVRIEWTPASPLPTPSHHLTFRTLEDVGEEAFIAAMARVSEGTLDSHTQRRCAEIGAQAEAREHFQDEQRFQKRWEPRWWQLAHDEGGALIGLVMPAENTSWPNIGYIGVVPAQRGHGYVDDLIIQGTRTLGAEGATRVIADTDVSNVPMANAFRRCGYAQYGVRRIFTLRFAKSR
jgi:RimJ/RimL family protein N-acetyltransferase